ncbi:hypothetical protein ABZ281_26040, partial [Streptomyces sp. NPDC006265]|uniref:hypothetical protein n=1 Tax=Streptomyces sp. NPDC006265 TaxID=3156740 RepID=UPI0033A143ED
RVPPHLAGDALGDRVPVEGFDQLTAVHVRYSVLFGLPRLLGGRDACAVILSPGSDSEVARGVAHPPL